MHAIPPFNYYVPRLTSPTAHYPTKTYQEIYAQHKAAIENLLPTEAIVDVRWVAQAGDHLYELFRTTITPEKGHSYKIETKSEYKELVESLYSNPLLRIKEIKMFYEYENSSVNDSSSEYSCESLREFNHRIKEMQS